MGDLYKFLNNNLKSTKIKLKLSKEYGEDIKLEKFCGLF